MHCLLSVSVLSVAVTIFCTCRNDGRTVSSVLLPLDVFTPPTCSFTSGNQKGRRMKLGGKELGTSWGVAGREKDEDE